MDRGREQQRGRDGRERLGGRERDERERADSEDRDRTLSRARDRTCTPSTASHSPTYTLPPIAAAPTPNPTSGQQHFMHPHPHVLSQADALGRIRSPDVGYHPLNGHPHSPPPPNGSNNGQAYYYNPGPPPPPPTSGNGYGYPPQHPGHAPYPLQPHYVSSHPGTPLTPHTPHSQHGHGMPHPALGRTHSQGQLHSQGQTQQAAQKRKRKSGDGFGRRGSSEEDDLQTPSTPAPSSAGGAAGQRERDDGGSKKRTKTQRACDSCRSRKIRCDIISGTEPPVCQHCKQYSFECTYFLPITETRFKKKTPLTNISISTSGGAGSPTSPPGSGAMSAQPMQITSSTSPASGIGSGANGGGERRREHSLHRGEVKVMGPTSATYLLHSTPTVNRRAYGEFDAKYRHRWEVSGEAGGVIQILEPPPRTSSSPQSLPHPSFGLSKDTLQSVLNRYWISIHPVLPLITRSEFASSQNSSSHISNSPQIAHSTPNILLFSACAVAATHRSVPQSAFLKLRTAVQSLIKSEDVLSHACLVHVKALLILAMSGDAHSAHVPSALSALWVRTGTAIRMAQDLGLHRTEGLFIGAASSGASNAGVKSEPDAEEEILRNVDMRRRLWAGCVIIDRWCSLAYGHPYMIDVEDCDARLPSGGREEDCYMDELVRLSVLLGKVMKMIYSPTGLTRATDAGLIDLLTQIDNWKRNLPPYLQFHSPRTASTHAGLLHLLYSCVCMIFWRVFMRISYECPAHLKFALTVERWSGLVDMTRESIEFLDMGFGEGEEEFRDGDAGRNESLYDCWLIVAYAATSCALVQYHTWARRQDPQAMMTLKRLRDCVKRWESALSPDHMSTRRKTAEIICLLYESTQKPHLNPPPSRAGSAYSATDDPEHDEGGQLNPTAGVVHKLGATKGIVWSKDDSRPGGGVFVADQKRWEKGNLPAVVEQDRGDRNRESSGGDSQPQGQAQEQGQTQVQVQAPTQASAGAGPVNPEMFGMGDFGMGPAGAQAHATNDGVPYLFPSRTGMVHPSSQAQPTLSHMPLPPPPGAPGGDAMQLDTLPSSVNLNPSLNMEGTQGQTQLLMNVPDHSMYPNQGLDLNGLMGADNMLQGIPGSMFDWEQWDQYFVRTGIVPPGGAVEHPTGHGGHQPGGPIINAFPAGNAPMHGPHLGGHQGGYPFSSARGE